MSPLVLVVLAPVLVAGLIAGLRAPVRVLVAAYAFMLPFGSSVSVSVGLPAPFNSITSLVGFAVLAGLLAHLALSSRSAPRLLPAVPAWLMFLALCGLTFAWSLDQAATARELLLLVSLVALYVVTMLMPVEERDLRRVRDAIILGGAVAGAVGIVLLLRSQLQITGVNTPRLAIAGGVGEGTDANITAATLILPLALAVGRALDATRVATRAYAWIASLVIGIGIVLTGSRGGMLAGIVVLAVFGLAHARRRVIIAAALGSALVIGLTLAAAPPALRHRVTKTSSSGRTDIWRTGLSACETYCWAGSGFGTFPDVYQTTLHSSPEARGLDHPFVAHNIWISAIVETGVIGTALLLLALALVARDLLRLPPGVRAPPLAGFVGTLVASSFLSTLGFKYFWLVIIYAGLTTLVYAPRPVPSVAWRSRVVSPAHS